MNKRREEQERIPWIVQLFIILISVVILFLFVAVLVKLSFQSGMTSSKITVAVSTFVGKNIFGDPTLEQIETINRIIRFAAHLSLFFFLGLILSYVSMLIFRHYYRIIGFVFVSGICYFLAYYTEYYKQFIAGRHFNKEDVYLNWIGSGLGICFMIFSYFMIKLLVKISHR